MLRSNIFVLLDELLLNFNSSTRILLHRNVEAAIQFHCVSVTGFCAGGQPLLLFPGRCPRAEKKYFKLSTTAPADDDDDVTNSESSQTWYVILIVTPPGVS
jgi:hypothetical protein